MDAERFRDYRVETKIGTLAFSLIQELKIKRLIIKMTMHTRRAIGGKCSKFLDWLCQIVDRSYAEHVYGSMDLSLLKAPHISKRR